MAGVLVVASLGALSCFRDRSGWAVTLIAAATVLGIADLKQQVFPALDQVAGTRTLWRGLGAEPNTVCMGNVRRHVDYGLSFYSRGEVPPCASAPRPIRIEEDPPRVVR